MKEVNEATYERIANADLIPDFAIYAQEVRCGCGNEGCHIWTTGTRRKKLVVYCPSCRVTARFGAERVQVARGGRKRHGK